MVLATTHASIDVTVRADGCRIVRLSDPDAHTEIRLQSALAVRLALPPGIDLPAPPLFLGVALDGDAWSWQGSPGSFDERGEIICQVAEPGPVVVRWTVERRYAGGRNKTRLDLPIEQVFNVMDVDGEQRFELAVTNDALAAALAGR